MNRNYSKSDTYNLQEKDATMSITRKNHLDSIKIIARAKKHLLNKANNLLCFSILRYLKHWFLSIKLTTSVFKQKKTVRSKDFPRNILFCGTGDISESGSNFYNISILLDHHRKALYQVFLLFAA